MNLYLCVWINLYNSKQNSFVSQLSLIIEIRAKIVKWIKLRADENKTNKTEGLLRKRKGKKREFLAYRKRKR